MRVHTKERPYKCRHEGCEKTFSASSSRVNHEQGHSGIKQFKCFYCPRYFKNWVSTNKLSPSCKNYPSEINFNFIDKLQLNIHYVLHNHKFIKYNYP